MWPTSLHHSMTPLFTSLISLDGKGLSEHHRCIVTVYINVCVCTLLPMYVLYRETIARVTGGMKVKADRDEVSLMIMLVCSLVIICVWVINGIETLKHVCHAPFSYLCCYQCLSHFRHLHMQPCWLLRM